MTLSGNGSVREWLRALEMDLWEALWVVSITWLYQMVQKTPKKEIELTRRRTLGHFLRGVKNEWFKEAKNNE